MADDNAIEQAAIARINGLFGRVEGASGKAATKLYDLANAGSAAQSSIGGFSTSMSTAAAGVYQAASSQKAAAKAASDAYRESASSVTSTIGSFSQNAMDKFSNMLQHQEEGAGMLGGALKGVGNSTNTAAGKLASLGKVSGIAGLAMKVVGGVAGLAGTALGMLSDYANDNLQKWESLTQSGIGLQGHYLALGENLATTRLSLGQLTQHLDKNSETLAKFGGIAGLGAEQLMNVQKGMQAFDRGMTGSAHTFQQTLRGMGVDADESMGLIASMMGDQMAMMSFRKMDEQEQSETTMEYIQQLDKLAKLTGESREALADQMAQQNFNQQLEAAMDVQGIMDAGARANIKMQMDQIEKMWGPEQREVVQAAFANSMPSTKAGQMAMIGPMGQAAFEAGQQLRQASAQGVKGMAPVWDSLNDQMGAAGEAQRSQYAAITATGAGFVEGVGGLYEAGAKAEARDNALRDSAAAAAKGLTALEASTMSLSSLIDEMVARDRGVTDDDKLDPPGTEATGAITRMDTQIRDVTLQVASFLASNNVLGSQTAMGGMNFVQGGIQDVMSMFMPAGYVGAGAQRSTEYGPATGKFKAGPGAVDVMFDGVGRTVNDVWQELKTRDSEEKQLAYLKQAQEVTGTDFLKRDAANQYNTYGERGRTRLVGGTGLAATETERRNQLEAAQKAMQEVDESKKWKGLGKFFTGDEGQGLSMAERIEKAIEKQTTELKPPAKEITANDPSGNAALDASGHYLSGTGVQ